MSHQYWYKIPLPLSGMNNGVHCLHTSIYHLAQLPKNEFAPDFHSSFTYPKWEKLAIDMLWRAFMSLFLGGYLSVSETKVSRWLIGKLGFKRREYLIQLQLTDSALADETLGWLEKRILEAITQFDASTAVAYGLYFNAQTVAVMNAVLETEEEKLSNPVSLLLRNMVVNSERRDLFSYELGTMTFLFAYEMEQYIIDMPKGKGSLKIDELDKQAKELMQRNKAFNTFAKKLRKVIRKRLSERLYTVDIDHVD